MSALYFNSFRHDLAATAWRLTSVLPAPAVAAFERGIYHVAASGALSHVLPLGRLAPDFTLPTAQGQPLHLRALLRRGPVVLTFFRGNWCPYGNVQLRAYQQQLLPQLAHLGATLVAVSPQTIASTALTASEKELTFPVLSDVGNRVARQFGLSCEVSTKVADALRQLGVDLRHYNGTTTDELPLTATFVIAPDGRISWRWVEADYKHLPAPAQLLAAVEAVAALHTA